MQELEKIEVPAGIKRLKFLCLSREELPEQYRGGDHKTSSRTSFKTQAALWGQKE